MYAGSNNPAYKGGTIIYKNGYRHMRGKRGHLYEHRVVMEKELGRPLHPWEEVHHINGNKLDNRPENLFILDRKNHTRNHFLIFNQVQQLERENQLLKEKLQSFLS